jgi:4-alpha-glucanotransferase
MKESKAGESRQENRAAVAGTARVSRESLGVSPFPPNYRASGLLLHVSSLPSPYGIGDFGPAALSWIDRLYQAGQRWWQVLPLGPTGYGNSPYQPLSSFAGNALLISPDWLMDDELLGASDCAHPPFSAAVVDYQAVIPFKHRLLEKAWYNFKKGIRSDLGTAYEKFCDEQEYWLADYALFRTLRAQFGDSHYLEWPAEFVQRKPAALNRARRELANQIDQVRFAQFLLFRQADRLKTYADEKGVRLIGDLPFFVSSDSSDVWANPELFLLNQQRRPLFVAGVPPDYFSAQGQLWGNPLYNWDRLRQSGYGWRVARLRSLLTQVSLIRLDHFRAFAAAWHIPAGAATAQSGTWLPGPGADFFRAVKRELGSLPFIAEDLGMITQEVYGLRDQFCLPGMRVLQFAFDGRCDNPYLPDNFVANTVVYTGTHDNSTARGWFESLTSDQRESVRKYLIGRGVGNGAAAHALMELAWSSVAALAITPLQDLLNLDNEARMNVPGHPEGNWRWRCTEEMLSDTAFDWLGDLTNKTNRSSVSSARDAKTLEATTTN